MQNHVVCQPADSHITLALCCLLAVGAATLLVQQHRPSLLARARPPPQEQHHRGVQTEDTDAGDGSPRFLLTPCGECLHVQSRVRPQCNINRSRRRILRLCKHCGLPPGPQGHR